MCAKKEARKARPQRVFNKFPTNSRHLLQGPRNCTLFDLCKRREQFRQVTTKPLTNVDSTSLLEMYLLSRTHLITRPILCPENVANTKIPNRCNETQNTRRCSAKSWAKNAASDPLPKMQFPPLGASLLLASLPAALDKTHSSVDVS